MTLYLSNRDGDGKTDEKGHYKFPSVAFTGEVVFPGLEVTQNSPTGLSVLVGTGDFRVDSGSDYTYSGWNTTIFPVTLSVADPANPRIDTIILYIDKIASTSPSPPNNPGIPKIIKVNGTPGAIPVAPNGTALQSAAGSGNPYIILADVRVNALATTIVNANITDRRLKVSVSNNLVSTSSITDSSVTSSKIATNGVVTTNITDANITTAKISNGGITTTKFKPSIINSNFTPAGARFQTSTMGTHAIPNCSLTYTAGSTNERLFIWLGVMAYKATGTAEIWLYVNGSPVGTSIYIDPATPWYRGEVLNIVDVTASSVTTLAVYGVNAAANDFQVTNELARWMPTLRGFSIYNGP